MHKFLWIFGIQLMLGCPTYGLDVENRTRDRFYSQAHFGYLIQNSSLGFYNIGGSTVILDTGRTIAKTIEFGLRTVATGCQDGESNFYRLATGPVIEFIVDSSWSFHFSIGLFNETANINSKLQQTPQQAHYSGQQAMAGWEKIVYDNGRDLKISWGGFFVHHYGNLTDSSSTAAIQPATPIIPSHSYGSSQGVEISTEFML